MKAQTLIDRFIDFFEKEGHRLAANASLVPESDSSVLFTTAGMHPLVPYLLGQKHPLGNRLCSLQRCLRTDDIDNVGDGFHHTFFEMLGNWSLGDYWKDQSINYSFQFLTKVLKLDPARIFISCFAGDNQVKKDTESALFWQNQGIPVERITYLGRKENWWGPVGDNGPCGPDTEIFFDTGRSACGKNCSVACNCGKYVEIWNNVFMQYNLTDQGEYQPLKQKNVDTGMGVERVTAITEGFKDDNYRTELFWPLIEKIALLSKSKYEPENYRPMRIIADHLRASVFLLADGVVPGNLGQQYILRRLIRRLTLQAVNLGIKDFLAPRLVPVVIDIYQSRYPFLPAKQVAIINAFRQEEEKFARIISPARLMKNKAFLADIGKTSATRLEQLKQSAAFAFESLATTGIPYDFQLEQAKELGLVKNKQETSQFEQFFEAKKKEHQQKSRASLKKRFAGGLADKDPATVKLHTVAHLLQQALRQILGSHVTQAGSNITSERLRFDFTHDQKLTSQQLEQVEQLVNLKIEQNLPVTVKTASLSQARQEGALFFFADRYQDEIKIYSIGDFSKEVCGGPHVGSTGEIGSVRIKKQESVGQGKKRLYVVLV